MIAQRARRVLGVLGTALLVSLASLAPAQTRAAAYPGLSYFHLPARTVGSSAPYGGEGGGVSTDRSGLGSCQTATTPTSRSCYGYFYGVAAAVPSRSHDGPYSFYTVDIFPSVAQAQAANSTTRDTLMRDDAGRTVPLLPIAQPLAPNEWLRGEVSQTAAPDCYAYGAVRYQNIVMFARVLVHGAIVPSGSYPCTDTYRWVTRRVLALLYPRAVAFVQGASTASYSPADLSTVDCQCHVRGAV